MFLMFFLSLILLLIVLHCKIRYGRIGRVLNKLPGPKAYPIIGNVHHFNVGNGYELHKLFQLNIKYFPIYKIWSLIYYGVMLLHPDDIKVLMMSTDNIGKEHIYFFLRPWLSYGLLTSTDKKWQIRRKMLTPAFHFKILEYNVITFDKEAHCLVESLKRETQGDAITKDLLPLITQHTLNIICETALGTSLKEKKELESKYRDAVHTFGQIVAYRLVRPWYYISSIFAFSSTARLQKRMLKILHSFSKDIIAERKSFHERTNGIYLYDFEETDNNDTPAESEDINKDSIYRKRLSLLDLLITASLNGNQIDDEGIREEVDTFMFEGHDTTAMALIFALCLFAKHQDIQQRIRDEISNVILSDDYKLTISDLQKLSYLDRCIKESLRLYPSVHTISRTLTHDLQLDNYLVPAGAICVVSIYNLHRNPRYWPDPNVFDPDRFLPENIKGHYPYSYIPFSGGRRNCIGQKFAMMELKVIIAHIVRNFYLEPVDNIDDVKFLSNITLRSSTPLRVKFIPAK